MAEEQAKSLEQELQVLQSELVRQNMLYNKMCDTISTLKDRKSKLEKLIFNEQTKAVLPDNNIVGKFITITQENEDGKNEYLIRVSKLDNSDRLTSVYIYGDYWSRKEDMNHRVEFCVRPTNVKPFEKETFIPVSDSAKRFGQLKLNIITKEDFEKKIMEWSLDMLKLSMIKR